MEQKINAIQKIDEEGTRKLMVRLMEEGVNYIDTARGYTVSESYLGYALEGIRDKFVLATKSMARTKEAMAKDRYSTLAVKASACIECGECETRCPYHLPIREMMKCAQDFGE